MAFIDVEDLPSDRYTMLNWAMFATGLLFTTLRLAVRLKNLRRLHWDDVLQIGGMISLLICTILNELQHDDIYALQALAPIEGAPEQATFRQEITDTTRRQAKLQFIFIIFFWTCLWFIKASFLMFYKRLFDGLSGYMKWWWIVVVTCIVTYIMCILSNFLECLPLSRRFELDLQGSCPAKNGIRFVAFTTALDIFTDILIMALPIRMLIGLRITSMQKFGVALIFTIAHVIIIFSILRVNELYISLSTKDLNMNVSISMWSIIEVAVAVVIGSLPTLKSLLSRKVANSSYASNTPRSGFTPNSNSAQKSKIKSLNSSRNRASNTPYELQNLPGDQKRAPYASNTALRPWSEEGGIVVGGGSGNGRGEGDVERGMGGGATVTKDVSIRSETRAEGSDGRDEISLESFITHR
ncbi:hypothetical protein B0J14DRAFT_649188 [Halenospora varia]|nr:hypothetical protein B0J14DRAFT_649188 [Halenospora varia]